MIKYIEDNNVFEAIQLMDKSVSRREYFGYKRNEAVWIEYFLSLVRKQKEGSPHAFVVGDYDNNNKVRGFLAAASFKTYYTNEFVMDVKDCIVDPDNFNAFVVCRLFDAMIAHTKQHGGKHWRADSIHSEEEAMAYGEFLKKRYNAAIHVSVRGVIQEN